MSNRWLARESIAPRDADRNANAWHGAVARFFQGNQPFNPTAEENASMKQSLIKRAPILFCIAALVACGGDSTAPNSTLAGAYVATQFVTTGTGGQTNQILAGSTVSVNLASNGSVTGHLHLVATNANPALDADLAGTWTQTGNTVTFAQTADTFINDMTFDVVANGNVWQLVGDQVFSGTQIQITLTQQATM
jgi:hypothetical protein